MLRAALLALAVITAVPASAAAAIGQVEPITVRGDDDCLRTTGTPGELALPGTNGVRFALASRAGLVVGPTIDLGADYECSAAVTRPGGAGALAGSTEDDRNVVISVRDPGGAWGAPVRIPIEENWRPQAVFAAVSDRGDVIVSWREDLTRLSSEGPDEYRFRAVRRAPGAAFGAVETLGATSDRNEVITPAISGTGEAFVLTTTVEGAKVPFRARVDVFAAAPGAPFGAPVSLGTAQWLSPPTLAVAPDGRALVAINDGQSMLVSEREPGGAFAPPVRIGATTAESYGTVPAIAIGAAGEAAVSWARYLQGDVQLASRRAVGPFGPVSRVSLGSLLPKGYDRFFLTESFLSLLFDGSGGLIYDEPPTDLVLTSDARAALAWFSPGVAVSSASLITAPLGGGAAANLVADRGIEPPSVLRGLTLADGTPALAWSDDATRSSFTLHLAAEGVTERPDPAPPRVTIGAPRSRVLSEDEALRLPVKCDRACEVSIASSPDLGDVSDKVRFARAGSGTLKIDGAAALAPARLGPVRLRIFYRALGALHARSRSITVRIAQADDLPKPRVTDLRAVRKGGSIRVSWRVTGRLGEFPEQYFVTATRTRATDEEPAAVTSIAGTDRNGRRALSVTLRAGAEARWVTVRTAPVGPRNRTSVRIGA